MLRVKHDGRIDDQTIRCRIVFMPREGIELRMVVAIRADLEEVPQLRLPRYVKLRALAIAQASAEKFVSVDVANLEGD